MALDNQSIPPFYLQDRFADVHAGPAQKDETERLYYITSHLNVDGVTDGSGRRVMKDWKLFLTTASKKLD